MFIKLLYIVIFATFRRAPKRIVNNYFAVAGTLKYKDFYRKNDSLEHGQWRRVQNVYYPKDYKFPTHDIAVVVRFSILDCHLPERKILIKCFPKCLFRHK